MGVFGCKRKFARQACKFSMIGGWCHIRPTTRHLRERALIFPLDSTLKRWIGAAKEAKTLKQTFVNNGVTTQDYEWRKIWYDS